MKVSTALISVSDKSGITDFVKGLSEVGIEIFCTEGTAAHLKDEGIVTRKISEITGYDEILGGRVKSIHPKIFGGILADRDNEEHLEQLEEYSIKPIDLVAVNFYNLQKIPFDVKNEKRLIEKIDIGGPSLARAAAKNYHNVVVVPEPGFYDDVLKELEKNNCRVSDQIRRKLALRAFSLTSEYDDLIEKKLNDRFGF